jgi:pilus assembly protein Flp/PilA
MRCGNDPEVWNLRSVGRKEGGEQMFLRLYARAQTWLHEERGATAVEYALMVALIAVVIIAAVTLLGTNASEKFDSVATEIGNA